MSEAVELVIKRLTDRLFDCLSDVEGEPVEGVVLKDDAADILEWARQLAAWNRRAKPPEGEPVACPACYRGEVFGLSTDDGFWVEMGASAGGANEHGLNGWLELIEHHPDGTQKRREYVATDSPLYTRPVAWPDREAVAVLLSLVTDAADDLSDTLGARNQEGGGGASADERNRLATLNRIAALLSASDGAGTEGGAR